MPGSRLKALGPVVGNTPSRVVAIAATPWRVRRSQVKASRSRHHPSARNRSAAALACPARARCRSHAATPGRSRGPNRSSSDHLPRLSCPPGNEAPPPKALIRYFQTEFAPSPIIPPQPESPTPPPTRSSVLAARTLRRASILPQLGSEKKQQGGKYCNTNPTDSRDRHHSCTTPSPFGTSHRPASPFGPVNRSPKPRNEITSGLVTFPSISRYNNASPCTTLAFTLL